MFVECSQLQCNQYPPCKHNRVDIFNLKEFTKSGYKNQPSFKQSDDKEKLQGCNYFAKDQINVNISLLKHFLLYQYREHISFCNMAPLLSQLYMVSFRNPSLNDLSPSLLVCSACQRRCVESVHIRSFAGLHSPIRTE